MQTAWRVWWGIAGADRSHDPARLELRPRKQGLPCSAPHTPPRPSPPGRREGRAPGSTLRRGQQQGGGWRGRGWTGGHPRGTGEGPAPPETPAHQRPQRLSHETTRRGQQGVQGQLSVKCWAQRSARRPSRPRAGMNSSGTGSGPFFSSSRSKICGAGTGGRSGAPCCTALTAPAPRPASQPHLEGGELQKRRNADLGLGKRLVNGAGGLGHLGVVMPLEGLEGHVGCHRPSWAKRGAQESLSRGTSHRLCRPRMGQTDAKAPLGDRSDRARWDPWGPGRDAGRGVQVGLGGWPRGSAQVGRLQEAQGVTRRQGALTCSSHRELSRARLWAGSSSRGS